MTILEPLEWTNFSTPNEKKLHASPASCHPLVFEILKLTNPRRFLATISVDGLPPIVFSQEFDYVRDASDAIEEWRNSRAIAQLTPEARAALNL